MLSIGIQPVAYAETPDQIAMSYIPGLIQAISPVYIDAQTEKSMVKVFTEKKLLNKKVIKTTTGKKYIFTVKKSLIISEYSKVVKKQKLSFDAEVKKNLNYSWGSIEIILIENKGKIDTNLTVIKDNSEYHRDIRPVRAVMTKDRVLKSRKSVVLNNLAYVVPEGYDFAPVDSNYHEMRKEYKNKISKGHGYAAIRFETYSNSESDLLSVIGFEGVEKKMTVSTGVEVFITKPIDADFKDGSPIRRFQNIYIKKTDSKGSVNLYTAQCSGDVELDKEAVESFVNSFK